MIMEFGRDTNKIREVVQKFLPSLTLSIVLGIHDYLLQCFTFATITM